MPLSLDECLFKASIGFQLRWYILLHSVTIISEVWLWWSHIGDLTLLIILRRVVGQVMWGEQLFCVTWHDFLREPPSALLQPPAFTTVNIIVTKEENALSFYHHPTLAKWNYLLCAVFAIPLGKRLLFSEAFMDHLVDNCRKSWIFYSVLLQQKEEYKREFIGHKYRRDLLRMGILNSIWIPQTSLKSYHGCHSSLQLSWENLATYIFNKKNKQNNIYSNWIKVLMIFLLCRFGQCKLDV